MKERTCFFTGHRDIPAADRTQVKMNTYALCRRLIDDYGVRIFLCGGALGFDMMAALVVLEIRKTRPDISLHLILPCKTQADHWSDAAKQMYYKIIDAADYVEYVSEQYTKSCMHARNRRMVDLSCCGIAFLRRATGGTAYTVRYAGECGVKVLSVDRMTEI